MRTIRFDEAGVKAEIVVRRASALGDVVHDTLVGMAFTPGPDLPPGPLPKGKGELEADALHTLAVVVWPVVRGATERAEIEVDGRQADWPMSLEAFADLPGELVAAWVQAGWDENPRWAPRGPDDPKAEGRPNEPPPTG